MTKAQKLLSIGSAPLAAQTGDEPKTLSPYPLAPELFRMLKVENGFYAFESALHVFPHTSGSAPGMSLEEWNSDSLWRDSYADLARNHVFFAEDVFRDQFCLSADEVLRFNAETGDTIFMAESIEQWAEILLRDYAKETGWPHAKRLLPKVPFFLGGEYSLENLWAGSAIEGMRLKGSLATQTRSLPDGTDVRLVIAKKPASN